MTSNPIPHSITMPDIPLRPDGSRPKIAVAMSGGVDSSMVAYLLAQEGYDLVGFTAWTLNGPGKCCNDALINAGRVCEMLNIPYDTVDLRAEFAHYVMDYYKNSYENGLTPNPCVECNRYVKWEKVWEFARDTLGADYVATGHYASIVPDPETQSVRIFRGKDDNKDQTYMLARVKPDDLKHTLFPLAYATKPELVALAQALDIPTAFSKESQDVCFVLNGQANYLSQLFGPKPGPIVDWDTKKVVGEHQGTFLFTLGQRKGLGVAAGRPVYVVKIDKEANTVYVGDKTHLESTRFIAKDVSWIQRPTTTSFESMVKIRYNTPSALAQCTMVSETDVEITYYAPMSAITPGQIAAFYDSDDNELWGGGYVQSHLTHQPFDAEKAQFPSFDEACGVFR